VTVVAVPGDGLRFHETERIAVCDLLQWIEDVGTPFEEPINFLFGVGRFKPQAAARAMWLSLLFRARVAPQSS
jgi:hypothetical protein